jgi:hypothetical protein
MSARRHCKEHVDTHAYTGTLTHLEHFKWLATIAAVPIAVESSTVEQGLTAQHDIRGGVTCSRPER